jgi:hypothetical protein
MKVGPNDVPREHFGHFLPFIWPEVPEKIPQIPRNEPMYFGSYSRTFFGGEMRKNAENADRN